MGVIHQMKKSKNKKVDYRPVEPWLNNKRKVKSMQHQRECIMSANMIQKINDYFGYIH